MTKVKYADIVSAKGVVWHLVESCIALPLLPVHSPIYFFARPLFTTRTTMPSCRTRKHLVHVCSPGVAATWHVWPAAAAAADAAVYRQCDD